MSASAEERIARPVRGRRAYWVLLGLVLGLSAGALVADSGSTFAGPSLRAAQLVGGLWLNALKMTVIPLIIALLVTAVAAGAEAARTGRIAAMAVVWFMLVYIASATLGAVAMPPLLQAFPLPESASQALRAGLATIDPASTVGASPGIADFFSGIIPSNVFSAASGGEVLQLVLFTVIFAIAVTRIEKTKRQALLAFFQSAADALLIVIGWVLWIAPLGVFALAYSVGSSAGAAAFGALAHYVVLVSALGATVLAAGYAVAVLAGRLPLAAFARAEIPPQSLAMSARSSLACLPLMLAASRTLGVRDRTANIVLPLAVALFRPTGPAMNVGVAIYVADWLGIELSVANMIAAVAVGAIISIGSVSVPGEVSFIATIAPIAMALGVPIAPLALLVAVEMIPDIFRTVGNVTMDVAVTAAVDRTAGAEPSES